MARREGCSRVFGLSCNQARRLVVEHRRVPRRLDQPAIEAGLIRRNGKLAVDGADVFTLCHHAVRYSAKCRRAGSLSKTSAEKGQWFHKGWEVHSRSAVREPPAEVLEGRKNGTRTATIVRPDCRDLSGHRDARAGALQLGLRHMGDKQREADTVGHHARDHDLGGRTSTRACRTSTPGDLAKRVTHWRRDV